MDPPSSSRKRPFLADNDDDGDNKSRQKRVRFPKGKKVKDAVSPVVQQQLVNEEQLPDAAPVDLSDPKAAAKERARRRSNLTTQLCTEEDDDDDEADFSRIAAAEVRYQENEFFDDDGTQMEPFNLEQERQEGYFDEAGNFVEYVADKEEKDAWLDSVEVDPKLAERLSAIPKIVDDTTEMTSDDIGKMKRRIADALEPGETVLQALKRLKGNSRDRKVKMPAETKHVFDQLTEDAMRLMENGDYNVYHEEKEVFEREAEGYEALARAKNGEETFDMFAADDDDMAARPQDSNLSSVPAEGVSSQPATEGESQDVAGSWTGQSDYVYDEASGYYYSSNLGYYYDSSTGLYCSATTGQWYKYNEESDAYDEVQALPDAATS